MDFNKTNAVAHSNHGLVLHHLKRFEEALKSYDRAIEINPDFAEAYINYGVTLKSASSHESAAVATIPLRKNSNRSFVGSSLQD